MDVSSDAPPPHGDAWRYLVALARGGANKSEKDAVNTVLFTYLSSLVAISLPTCVDAMSLDAFEQFGNAAVSACEHPPSNDADLQTSSISSLSMPRQLWPASFADYMNSLQALEPGSEWCNQMSIASYPPERKRMIFLGNKVRSAFAGARNFIQKHLNVLWNSGHQHARASKASRLLWVRKELWSRMALQRAHYSVRQKYCRKNRGTGAKYSSKEHLGEINYVVSRRNFQDSWFPPCWLAFVYLGLPSDEPSELFITSATVAVPAPTLTNAEMQQIHDDIVIMPNVSSESFVLSPRFESRKRRNMDSQPIVVRIALDEVKVREMKVECLRSLMRPEAEIIEAEEELLAALNRRLSKFE